MWRNMVPLAKYGSLLYISFSDQFSCNYIMHTSSIYQITPKLKILVFINGWIQPIIIVGSTILVQDFVPSFRAPKVRFELPSTFASARYSRLRRIIPVHITTTINESLIYGSPCNVMVEHFGIYLL